LFKIVESFYKLSYQLKGKFLKELIPAFELNIKFFSKFESIQNMTLKYWGKQLATNITDIDNKYKFD